MIEWLKKKIKKNHISKEQCFVFHIVPKDELINSARYETFKIKEDNGRYHLETDTAVWCKERDCFVSFFSVISYEDFKPIKHKSFSDYEPYNYEVISYNPNDINALDLEELKKITFDLNDDNTESDEVWERLINYFEERGF